MIKCTRPSPFILNLSCKLLKTGAVGRPGNMATHQTPHPPGSWERGGHVWEWTSPYNTLQPLRFFVKPLRTKWPLEVPFEPGQLGIKWVACGHGRNSLTANWLRSSTTTSWNWWGLSVSMETARESQCCVGVVWEIKLWQEKETHCSLLVTLRNGEPRSCAYEYNYVARLLWVATYYSALRFKVMQLKE